MWWRALGVWGLLLVFAIANGAVREGVLAPRFGARTAHVASTISLSFLILATAWLTSGFVGYRSGADGWTVGVLWVALTLAFEFLAGHYLFGQPWDVLLADYDLAQGRIWPLALASTLIAPVLASLRG